MATINLTPTDLTSLAALRDQGTPESISAALGLARSKGGCAKGVVFEFFLKLIYWVIHAGIEASYRPCCADSYSLSSLSVLVKIQVRVMLRTSSSLRMSGGNGA